MADEGAANWVQYSIFSDAACTPPTSLSVSASRELLGDLRNEISAHLQPLLQGYLWQHDPFDLELVTGTASSPSHLSGTTRFGDNIEDEWFIVYLMYTISREIPGISITVRDNDGEFLLIEAAYAIPRWLKPENSLNRVFIREGSLYLIGRTPKSPAKLGPLSVEEAVAVMKDGKSVTKASEEVQELVARRIKEYPERARTNMQKARCVVPLQVAHILKQEPQMVALAVEAFYRRNIDAMKAATKLEKFLPVQDDGAEKKGEMVEALVTMSRAMYAQLHQQVFAPPRKYPMPPITDPRYKEAELGMKLTCGFEMMYWERDKFETDDGSIGDRRNKGSNVVPATDPGWQVYRRSLENRGYFRGLLEGSREHTQLLHAAVADYRRTQSFSSTSAAMHAPIKRINEILSLLHTAADFAGPPLPESDNDSWLYDGEADLAKAMRERQAEMEAHESNRATQQNPNWGQPGETASEPLYDPEELVQGMQAFMSKISSYEGAELPNDEAVSINMSRFMHELESALGTSGGATANFEAEDFDDSDLDMDSDDTDDEMLPEENDAQRASSSMGEPAGAKEDESTSKAGGGFMDEYSDALQHELQRTSLAKSFATAEEKDEPAKAQTSGRPQEDDDDQNGIVDVDMNLLTSLLQSYMNQEGMPGPASNLLGAMGIKLTDPSAKHPGTGGK